MKSAAQSLHLMEESKEKMKNLQIQMDRLDQKVNELREEQMR